MQPLFAIRVSRVTQLHIVIPISSSNCVFVWILKVQQRIVFEMIFSRPMPSMKLHSQQFPRHRLSRCSKLSCMGQDYEAKLYAAEKASDSMLAMEILTEVCHPWIVHMLPLAHIPSASIINTLQVAEMLLKLYRIRCMDRPSFFQRHTIDTATGFRSLNRFVSRVLLV